MTYGEHPLFVVPALLEDWTEFMHYQYLPVKVPGGGFVVPPRLGFAAGLVAAAWEDWCQHCTTAPDPASAHVYVTARCGWATPDNPINRPGWHCDGFGTDDTNYVWWDRWPTRFLLGSFPHVAPHHEVSVRQFDMLAQGVVAGATIVDDLPGEALYRLSPYVVHSTPLVPPPGGMRRFLKVSISAHQYNLVGNSRNHGLAYDWPMYPREVVRNDPHYAGTDHYVPEP